MGRRYSEPTSLMPHHSVSGRRKSREGCTLFTCSPISDSLFPLSISDDFTDLEPVPNEFTTLINMMHCAEYGKSGESDRLV